MRNRYLEHKHNKSIKHDRYPRYKSYSDNRESKYYHDDKNYDYEYEEEETRHEYDEETYIEDIEHWTNKLKRKDRFKTISRNEIINQAKQMGVKFDEYSELEFYAIYLMLISDFKTISNDHRVYIGMTREWLEDDDIELDPSEKVCAYYYNIVKGEM